MKAVILAGGLGTRLREETEFRPKPMVEIGGQPILWHIMKIFSHFDVNEFVVCIGYRGDVIKDYFANYETRSNDFTVRLGATKEIEFHDAHLESEWRVTLVDTGQETMTGGRVKRVEPYVADERCIVTYGDGLADVDITALLAFHERHGRLATMTTVRPLTRFGVVDLDEDGRVRRFREKPQTDEYVNGGFFVFEPKVLAHYLDLDSVLEQEPLEALAKDGELMAYRHEGFWQPMDTYREFTMLNELWLSGHAPWKVWDE
ncbi:MAG: glucose-1-phosphate cytidylyltransferase [Acidimicrobiia bacterium]|nr:glucose-1-phosphate cytidylyltransferase [Acidimicrobiia bacterium]